MFVVQYYGHKEVIAGVEDIEVLYKNLSETFDMSMVLDHNIAGKAMLYIDIAAEIRYIQISFLYIHFEYSLASVAVWMGIM